MSVVSDDTQGKHPRERRRGGNGLTEYCHYCEKFDTAASMNMSGVRGRLVNIVPLDQGIAINGFNGSRSSVTAVGSNRDNKREYYVEDMPSDLVLFGGAAVLFKDSGVVLTLSDEELQDLKQYISQYSVLKRLNVVNRTYEVDNTSGEEQKSQGQGSAFVATTEEQDQEAMNSTAARYFNTKVNVSNTTQRILAMLLTGMSFKDLYLCVKNKSLGGMHPDLTIQALNHFEHKYGRTPDVVRLANPANFRSRSGLMSSENIERVGERVEMDGLVSDYNETVGSGKTKKLPTHGGAVAAVVASGRAWGKLLKSTSNARSYVLECIENYRLYGIKIELLAADSGITSQSMFEVFTTDVEKLLQEHQIKQERAEPYNHSRGTPVVERVIRAIKELIRLAMMYILTNPNFESLGFTKVNILKLWGELFYWSINVINFKPCPHKKEITRYEAFYGKKPNIQNMRILPIFSVVLLYRDANMTVVEESSEDKVVTTYSTNQPVNRIGLYVGPSLKTPGAIRAASMTGSNLKIFVTSKFTAATDGGGLNIRQHVSEATKEMIKESSITRSIEAVSTTTRKEQGGAEEDNSNGSNLLLQDRTAPSNDSNESSTEMEQPVETARGYNAPDSALPQSGLEEKQEVTEEERKQHSAEREERDQSSAEEQEEEHVKPSASSMKNRKKNSAKKLKTVQFAKNTGAGQPEAVAEPSIREHEDPYTWTYRCPKTTRGDRLRSREERREQLPAVANFCMDVETACLADSGNFKDQDVFWSWGDMAFVVVREIVDDRAHITEYKMSEDGFTAVTKDVPRTYAEALCHPKWGEPARKEWNTLISTQAIVQVDREVADNCIKNHDADLVILFPVYEEKVKDGITVYKVRLVGDGRTHHNAGNTYSATPSREELLVVLHIVASLGWDYAHVDEIRAFLSAKYKGEKRVFTKLRHDRAVYEVKGALYGLKTSPKDYQDEVTERLTKLGYTRLKMCGCIYIKRVGNNIVMIYDFVDDFVFTGDDHSVTEACIMELRSCASTTEPVWNAPNVLGLEIERDFERNIICIRLSKKITELYEKFHLNFSKKIDIPMPTTGYIVKEEQYGTLHADQQRLLDKKEIHDYMAIIGSLIWIAGIRHDIIFTVMYLSWCTKSPRQHHMYMAKYCVAYLYQSRDIPLVLGGSPDLQVTGFTDASLGTATKGRSVIGHMIKLNDKAGSVYAKASATTSVHTSSFEAELDGMASVLKSAKRVMNILTELQQVFAPLAQVYSDNKAMLEFVRGHGVAKGVRHMELRMWYIREKYQNGDVVVDYMEGISIPADKLTKLGSRSSHAKFRSDILGLSLLKGGEQGHTPQANDEEDA
eukprot:gene22931-29109_t